MDYKTLREVIELTGVSRRAIQGYEMAGLVAAIDKNARGYLLYDGRAIDRIQLIKLFQLMGFSVKQIAEFIDEPKAVVKDTLEKKISGLQKRKEEIDQIINRAYRLIEQM